jgi:glycosyl-4,4'-diaponeurosporenoate acyltransferase
VSGADPLVLVLVNSAVWAVWGTAVGYAGHRLPLRVVDHDNRLTRIRRWERGGRTWERVGIRRWKDRLPEAGAFFGGGMSKRSLPGRDADDLARFAAETRRAELVHWAVLAIVPVFALWSPPLLFAAMVAYGVVANVPCIAVQRFNRARIVRVLARRERALLPG